MGSQEEEEEKFCRIWRAKLTILAARVAVGKTKPEKVEPTTVVDQMVVSEGSHGV